MVVISYSKLREFFEIHADAKDALNNWYRLVIQADWSNFHEIKRTFNAVDAVGNDRFVFNIRGNNYRIVAIIFFDIRTVIYGLWVHTKRMIRLNVVQYIYDISR